MGFIKRIIKSQLVDVIQWIDESDDTLVYRFDTEGKEIMMGAQLTVRESQMAIFMNEGQIADVYGPGRVELTTQNMPILTALKSWQYGFQSPFKADVFFVNMRQFLDQKWGTTNPVMMRDKEFGMLRLRGFGVYAFRVIEPATLLRQVMGASQWFTLDGVTGQLKRMMVSSLSDALAEANIPALDLASNYDELGEHTRQRINTRIQEYGLELASFIIENLSLPEEVEKVLDKRTSMGVLGDMNQYTRYQAAEAIRDAAQNPSGGLAGAGVGMGAGAAIGQMFAQAMAPSAPQSAPSAMVPCAACKAQIPQDAKFCPVCGASAQPTQKPCVKCGVMLPSSSKFCPECGASQAEPVCIGCGATLQPGVKFCPACGAKQ